MFSPKFLNCLFHLNFTENVINLANAAIIENSTLFTFVLYFKEELNHCFM